MYVFVLKKHLTTNNENKMQNSHSSQTISKTRNQNVNREMFAATKYFHPLEEIES